MFCTCCSTADQYYTSAGRAEETDCRMRAYQSDHSNSLWLLLSIAACTRRTSEGTATERQSPTYSGV